MDNALSIYRLNDREIYVNFSDRHDFGDASPHAIERLAEALAIVQAQPRRKAIGKEVEDAVTLIVESEAVIQSDFFLKRLAPGLQQRTAERFVAQTTLGFSLVEALAPAGLFATLDRRSDDWRNHMRSQIFRVLAAVTMMVIGADHVSDIPNEAFIDIISHFRTDDGLRWRTGLLGSEEVSATCLREFTRALGKFLGDDRITELAKQHRTTSNSSTTWKAFQANPFGIRQELLEYYKLYSEDSTSNPKIDRQVLMDLDKVISGLGYRTLREALSQPVPSFALSDLYKARNNGNFRKSTVQMLRQAKRLSDFIIQELSDDTGIVYFPIVTDREISPAANFADGGTRKRSEAAARAMPERFHFLAKQVLDEGASGWPGKNFFADIADGGLRKKTYCPVLPTLLRCMLEIPLRTIQFRRFDSGEGDLVRFDGSTMTWVTNKSPNAGYWFRHGKSKKDETRGYAHRFEAAEPEVTGINVNSNKTGEPWAIPWMSPHLFRILWELAEWQLEHNPVSEPIGPDKYTEKERTPAKTKRKLPSIFALFRMPPSSYHPIFGKPPTHGMIGKAFCLLMYEVECRWNKSHPETPVTIVTAFNKSTGQPETCVYSLHGLRVRGITDLYRAGVPIEIISKLVAGHASVAMTLYYMLFDPGEISAMLNEKMASSRSKEVVDWMQELRTMKVEQARLQTTYVDQSTVEQIENTDKNLFSNVDIGACLCGGEGCGDGGELESEEKIKGVVVSRRYKPVPGGARNCILCRHFCSGTPFIFQLELYGTLLISKRNKLSGVMQEHRERARQLSLQKSAGEISREAYRERLERLTAEAPTILDEISVLDQAIFRVRIHLDAASKIVKADVAEGRTPCVALVANDTASAVDYVERDPADLASIINQASKFWSILQDDTLKQTQTQFVDQVMWNSGEAPISLRADLTDSQREAASDVLSRFLLQRVSALDRRALSRGERVLKDLKLEGQVRDLVDQVKMNEIPLASKELAGIHDLTEV